MKRFALAVLVSILFASVSSAQQNPSDAPASQEDIEKYFDVMHIREMMKTILDAMTKQMRQMTHEQLKKQPNLPPDAEARMEKITDDMVKDFPFDDVIQAMIPVDQKHLTKGDVDALVVFYSSPTGQKVLKEMPAMTTEGMQAASGIFQKIMAKAQERVKSEIAQMQKETEGNPPKQAQSTPN